MDNSMTLDGIVGSDQDQVDPIHLLLVGDTKTGKSTYAAYAAKAGFRVLYIDCDNGLSALKNALKDDPAAMARVIYIRTSRPGMFITEFLRSTTRLPFRWNMRMDYEFNPALIGQLPEDPVIQLISSNMPKDLVVVTDSWTAFSADCMGIGAKNNSADLLKLGDSMQRVYGDANGRATLVANQIQKHQSHFIVQAHGTYYERYEKPDGKTSKEAKQHEFVLKETIQVPLSVSRPHGVTMASRFNYIGWLGVDRVGRTEIDFTRRPDRVGGGPPNTKALTSELTFAKLVGSVPTDPGMSDEWIRKSTVSEFLPKSKPAGATGVTPQKAPGLAGAQPALKPQQTLPSRPKGMLNLKQ